MFAPPGYVPISALWDRFRKEKAADIYVFACNHYKTPEFLGTSLYGAPNEFGSPLDFVEDIFIATLRPLELVLCASSGDVVSTSAHLADGAADWLDKMTVFESTCTSEEAESQDWLRRMGSGAFKPWPEKLAEPTIWAEQYPAPGQPESLAEAVGLCKYHTLPMWFERHQFTITGSPPPWTSDAIDEAFAQTAIEAFCGWSICLLEKHAKTWDLHNMQREHFRTHLGERIENPIKQGRPGKQERALRLYDQLYPDGDHPSWKVVCEEIKKRSGLTLSPKTLIRALKHRKKLGQN